MMHFYNILTVGQFSRPNTIIDKALVLCKGKGVASHLPLQSSLSLSVVQ